MIRFFLGTLLGACVGYAMGSYAMLARPLVEYAPNVAELSDAEMHEVARLLDQPVEFVAMAGGRN